MLFRKRAKPTSNDNQPTVVSTPASPASLIGRGMVVEGDVSSEGDIHVDGTLRGKLQARHCVIELNGLVEGDVIADEIVVRGRVVGPMRAYHVHVEAGARIEGDVVNASITVDSGAEIHGAIWHNDDPFAEETQSRFRPAAAEREDAASRERPSYLESPLWNSGAVDDYRPIVAVRPR
ncbi:bactofilin family protein [Aestuariivirga sp.]|uniref:bactofilin family protein n=1 Tax=Aestuariivirga sp. TaxID=2650926 RepID=UPI0039E53823